MEFKIYTSGETEVQIEQGFHAATNFKNYQLPGGEFTLATGGFGKGLFFRLEGNGFEIWYSHYLIAKDTILLGRADIPALELHIQYANQCSYLWEGIGEQAPLPSQFNLSYTPYVNTRAEFRAGVVYSTFDIHYSQAFLRSMAVDFPLLDQFLEKVEKGQASELSPNPCYCSREMLDAVHSILKNPYGERSRKWLLEIKATELLLGALETVSGPAFSNPLRLKSSDMQSLYYIRSLLEKNPGEQPSLDDLARKGGINYFKLKKGFKQVFNNSVYQYHLELKMSRASQLLADTNQNVNQIADTLGYNQEGSFSAAFKKHFGVKPSEWRKRHRFS